MKIDYVIAWVDGQDQHHAATRNHYLTGRRLAHSEATTDERFYDSGEIYYHIASLLKYAPFINRVHIVTDNQRPPLLEAFAAAGLCRADFLNLVSHDEIFAGLDAVRPSFNSLSIETVLWRISGLSEHFIYANDDFFFNAPAKAEDFFVDDRPMLRGVWRKPEDKRLKYRLRRLLSLFSAQACEDPKFLLSQWKAAELAGHRDGYLAIHHHPHPLRRATFARYFAEQPDQLRQQLSFRFRNACQFNPVSLANHREILQHQPQVRAPADLAYVDFVKPTRVEAEMCKILIGSSRFGCIQGFNLFDLHMRGRLHAMLQQKFADTLPLSIKAHLQGEIQTEAFVAAAE